MSNGQFDDVGVLTTLERLRQNGLLGESDLETLRQQLKTDWGRQAFAAWHTQDQKKFQPARSVLQRFSNAFS
jgi:hypothetical protein